MFAFFLCDIRSWSTRWGEDGYFRIAQEGGGKWGLFGVLVGILVIFFLEWLETDSIRTAEDITRAIDIPVTGLDFIVPAVDGPEYAIIEANERPGLANHEPQPTAERFIDLLFPQTASR